MILVRLSVKYWRVGFEVEPRWNRVTIMKVDHCDELEFERNSSYRE